MFRDHIWAVYTVQRQTVDVRDPLFGSTMHTIYAWWWTNSTCFPPINLPILRG
jgi:hypothetical protein